MLKNTIGQLTYTIDYDDYAENPIKDYDLFGTFVTSSRNLVLGEDLSKYDDIDDYYTCEGLTPDTVIELPIYMYAHSGMTIKTSSFNCNWDSGQIGYIYVSKDNGYSEFNTVEEIIKALKSTVSMVDQWLTGQVYEYTIENENGEVIDSCSGFYSDSLEEVENYVVNEVLPFI